MCKTSKMNKTSRTNKTSKTSKKSKTSLIFTIGATTGTRSWKVRQV